MAFATPADMEERLGVSYTATEVQQASAFLGDATAFLQAEIGQLITSGTATFTTRVRENPIRLPQQPVTSVTTVLVDGEATTDFEFVDQELWVPARRGHLYSFNIDDAAYVDVTVTFNYGYATVPADLKSWCIVLASQSMDAAKGGSLGAPRVQSEQIDDYSVTYVTNGSSMTLPPDVLSRLRSRYGAGAYVTGVGR